MHECDEGYRLQEVIEVVVGQGVRRLPPAPRFILNENRGFRVSNSSFLKKAIILLVVIVLVLPGSTLGIRR